MKIKLLWISLALTLSAQVAALESSTKQLPVLKPLQQQYQAAHLSAQLLMRYHYKPTPLDHAMSEKIFDRYLQLLDPERIFFIQADIDQFSKSRSKLDDAILKDDLSIPFAIFNLYQQRISERFTYGRSLLKQGFDFEKKETYQYDRDKESWLSSEIEMRELWRKRVKNDWLRLKLAGKAEKNIAEILDKRFSNYLSRAYKLKSDDVFQTFMNAYATSIEPHTNYLGPSASENFDISMKLSLVGIGAVLEEKDEYTTIRELFPGGPAALSGKLKVGDRIVGVKQGESGTMIDVLGWRLDDTVALIRGPADSTVLLDIFPAEAGPDGKHKIVQLVRKKINLEQQAAKKSIIEVKDGNITRRIGVISLPTFYQDFGARQQGEKDFKSATRDVARLLEELKNDKAESVLIDLRNNGGGSLSEAIELTGLFIDKGPVVQQRNSQGKISVESDLNPGFGWDGPLGVLINRGSASASEIFAAAIQDYGRGLVIGEPSFGKGTVQTLLNLDQVARNEKAKLGELKMTIAQFFRINGGTTQLRGVTPDIAFPSFRDPENFGESSFENALPWTQIKAADYALAGNLSGLLPMLQSRHEVRIAKNKGFQFLKEDIADFRLQRKKKFVSLNESERRKERDALEVKAKLREKINGAEKPLSNKLHGAKDSATAKRTTIEDDGLLENERNIKNDLSEQPSKNHGKDILLSEAAHILSDEISLLKANARLLARVLPGVSLPSNP